MTLQRRVLALLLLAAPLVWGMGLLFGLNHVRGEIDELFDTQQVQLARQMLAVLPSASLQAAATQVPLAPVAALGEADTAELSIAVWDRQGALLLSDREGGQLAFAPERDGFVEQRVNAQAWRVYYQRSASGEWLVAVGQRAAEREELVRALLLGQLVPWLLTLPALLIAMALAVRQALKPLRRLTAELQQRRSDDLGALHAGELPSDLRPLVSAMNGLLRRVGRQIEHERRFTADAAHELRTPLAALQAQWDAARLDPGRAASPGDAKISEGLERLSRLVTQMLELSRLEHLDTAVAILPVDWMALVEPLFGELLPLAERHRVELACEWPAQGEKPLLRSGDSALLTLMLRNLLDNAVRHSPPGGRVTLRLAEDAIEVLDQGPGVAPERQHRLGDRFFRLPGQTFSGSGLGLSIVRRIAELHGLALSWDRATPGAAAMPGLRVRLSRAAPGLAV
jgi:two-component system sensor histidine kinase QseC